MQKIVSFYFIFEKTQKPPNLREKREKNAKFKWYEIFDPKFEISDQKGFRKVLLAFMCEHGIYFVALCNGCPNTRFSRAELLRNLIMYLIKIITVRILITYGWNKSPHPLIPLLLQFTATHVRTILHTQGSIILYNLHIFTL